MTKAELVAAIARQTGLDRETVLTVVEQLMESIKGSLLEGDPVFLRGFGSFILKARAEKKGRNIKKETSVIIPAHNIPFFKPSPEFKEALAPGLEAK